MTPVVTPDLLAALIERAPKRWLAKLDASTEAIVFESEGDGFFTTLGSERLTFAARVATESDVRCTCLLSPRCLHVLRALRAMPLGEDSEEREQEHLEAPEVVISEAGERAAKRAFDGVAGMLERGALGQGSEEVAQLLRALHALRGAGLHRAAGALTRVVSCLREGAAPTELERLSADACDLLLITRELQAEQRVPLEIVGVGRRRFEEVAHLDLHGVFVEPVSTRRGYAGVVTWLVDAAGTLYALADIAPGSGSRVAQAYTSGALIGDLAAPPERLGRGRLLLQRARVSADRRLGRGGEVRAAEGKGAGWESSPVQALFDRPWEAQLDAASREPIARDAPMFTEAHVVADGGRLLLRLSCGALARAHAPIDSGEETLAALARADGARVRIVARLAAPGELTLLAFAPDSAAVHLPEALGGRVFVGLDSLAHGQIVRTTRAPQVELPASPDPLHALRRRLRRVVLGGRSTLALGALEAIARESSALDQLQMPSAASALRALTNEALKRPRSLEGRQSAGDPRAFADAWLAATLYEQAASAHLERSAWVTTE